MNDASLAGSAEYPYYLSQVDGIAIAWAFCGTCSYHITTCTCANGPSEPRWMASARTSVPKQKSFNLTQEISEETE